MRPTEKHLVNPRVHPQRPKFGMRNRFASGRHNPHSTDPRLRAMSSIPAPDSAPEASPEPAPAPTSAPAPRDAAAELKQRFPALFVGAPKPLKLRIQIDIQERAPGVFTKQVLSAFFRRYTGSTAYLIAVTKAPHRYDLEGQPAGEVSAEHRQIAQDELTRRRANHEARRELEEQQRRNRAGLLRDFETTTLTRANFCVLKSVAPEELDGLLEIARAEAAERAQQQRAAPPPRPEQHRHHQQQRQQPQPRSATSHPAGEPVRRPPPRRGGRAAG